MQTLARQFQKLLPEYFDSEAVVDVSADGSLDLVSSANVVGLGGHDSSNDYSQECKTGDAVGEVAVSGTGRSVCSWTSR